MTDAPHAPAVAGPTTRAPDAGRAAPPPRRNRLPVAELALIASELETSSPAELAARLGRPYATVAQAAWRMRRAGGWLCKLSQVACTECGGPVQGPPNRTAHLACAPARDRRQQRERNARNPERYRATREAWLARHPEAVARERARVRAARRAAYDRLSAEQRAASWGQLHEADRQAQQRSAAGAARQGHPWTAEEDRYLLDRPHARGLALALALGRTLVSVRSRRQHLRLRGLLRSP